MRKFVSAVGLSLLAASAAHAASLASFDFVGSVSSENFYPYPPSVAAAGVTTGDSFRLRFDLDLSVGGGNSFFGERPGAVKNVVASFPDRGFSLTADSGTFSYYTVAAGPANYRWDIPLTGVDAGYTMIFWFRTTNPGVVTSATPTTIDPSQFNYLHEFAIYHGTYPNGGPTSLAVNLSTAPVAVPLPSTAGMGLGLIGLTGGASLVRRRRASLA